MRRIARFGGLPLLALVALGCGGGGGVKYVTPTIDFDARAADAPSEMSPNEAAADGPTDAAVATDTATDLGPCPFGGAVPIYCSGGTVYEPSPLIACIGGGHVYGTCPNGCAAGMVMGPVADPLALLCAGSTDGAPDGQDTADAGSDGPTVNDAGTEQ